MIVAGRTLVAPFNDFWDRFKADISILIEHIEEGHSSVFGAHGMDLTAPNVPDWMTLPDDELSYHVAHELTHIAMRQRGFPRAGRGKQYSEDSAEARIGGDLEEMVLHPALSELLCPFGFRREVIQSRMVRRAYEGLTHSPVPERGTPWFFIWAIRYCELALDVAPSQWETLESIYAERAPEVRELGKELMAIMQQVGWGTQGQALDAMVIVRDALGLKVDDRVLVVDPAGGQVL